MLNTSQKAFTLAEVLIALALLGIIAAFTIPKVLQNSQNAQRSSIFKESVALLNSMLYEGMLTGELYQDNVGYYTRQLNAIKTCPTNYVAEGCSLYTPVAPDFPGAGVILPNGAAILDFEGGYSAGSCDNNACPDGILIDWNGNNPPNAVGEDILRVVMNFGKINYINNNPTIGAKTLSAGVKPGAVGPACNVIDLPLYNLVFNTNFTAADCAP